jgi:phosphoribosylformylglycinamidine synthase subunit PurL
VGADTVVTPGLPAGVVRVHGTGKALAFTSDVTPRYVKANPFEGGKQAVAEAYRNLTAVGARPLATTDNLNFGNPEKPEIMGQFVGAIKGIGAAVAALDMPIVSGNVSLYNETDGQASCPRRPSARWAFWLAGRVDRRASRWRAIGGADRATCGHLGQSALLAEVLRDRGGRCAAGRSGGRAAHGEFLRANRALIRAATVDLGDGGLALAAFEMAEGAGPLA